MDTFNKSRRGSKYEIVQDEEKQELIEAYMESLDIKKKEIDEEIKRDEDLKQFDDAVAFMTSVYKGETKLEGQEELQEEIESKIHEIK